ncbi:MAG: hypothetical protein IPL79_01015 [Myxococcales bacterium]|nr:hypothetical protein [Myxococcales bacterium]
METKRPVGDPLRYRVTLANGTTVYAKWARHTDNRGSVRELPATISGKRPATVPYKWQTWPPIYSDTAE